MEYGFFYAPNLEVLRKTTQEYRRIAPFEKTRIYSLTQSKKLPYLCSRKTTTTFPVHSQPKVFPTKDASTKQSRTSFLKYGFFSIPDIELLIYALEINSVSTI